MPAIVAVWGFVEGVSLPLPMPGGVVLGGLAMALRPSLWQIAGLSVYASLGYCGGASVAYWIGLKVRASVTVQRWLARIGIGPERLAALDRLFARHGQWAVAWTRPFWIGNYISVPAGMARMPFWPFLWLTFVGIYPTAFLFLWAGEEMAKLTQRYGTVVIWGTLGLFVAVFAGQYWWKRREKRRLAGSSGG